MTTPTTDARSSGRDYSRVLTVASSLGEDASREERMRAVADALWNVFGVDRPTEGDRSVSWVGFYTRVDGETREGHEMGPSMVLGPSRNKPACSPIGLHGACGQSFVGAVTLIVRDVKALGAGYVACDPRDRAELVVPCVDEHGTAWGVIDFDSWDADAFDETDADAVDAVLRAAGLLHGPIARRVVSL